MYELEVARYIANNPVESGPYKMSECILKLVEKLELVYEDNERLQKEVDHLVSNPLS